jgi:hypothetical protein
METSTIVIGGAILVVVVVGVVAITSRPDPVLQQGQPTQQGNAATNISQGITQGLLGWLSREMSNTNPGNTPSGASRASSERPGFFQDNASGWLYGPRV